MSTKPEGLAVGLSLLFATLLLGCEAPQRDSGGTVQRDTLANGVVRVTHPGPAQQRAARVEPDLVLGAAEGDQAEIFGDVRSVEADEDGAMYVLDGQSSEVRVFDSEGRHLRTLAGPGEGPGELVAANGMAFSDDGVLWIHDYGQWRMVGLDPQGREVARTPIHVLSFSHYWAGAMDHAGRFWKLTTWPIEPRSREPEVGLLEGRSRWYMSWHDPGTGATDSVFVGMGEGRAFGSTEGGYRYHPIPFDARASVVVDPTGGFWATPGDRYQIARLDERGDTVLVLEAPVEPKPVTEDDRERFVDAFVRDDPEHRRVAEALIEHAGESHPVIDQLFLDDEGRLWVRRSSPGAGPRYDLFTRAGHYLGALLLEFTPVEGLPPRVRDGFLYAVVADELGVQRVVRAAVPVERPN